MYNVKFRVSLIVVLYVFVTHLHQGAFSFLFLFPSGSYYPEELAKINTSTRPPDTKLDELTQVF